MTIWSGWSQIGKGCCLLGCYRDGFEAFACDSFAGGRDDKNCPPSEAR
jgi:hypothetical protein